MSIELFELRTAMIGENFPIKRAIPQKKLRNIGHWVFLDHAGPTLFKGDENVDVGPHPHIGLQTFTWMLEGEIIHNDSLGNDQIIRPYQINLMTGGNGIAHTELSHPDSPSLHLAQLWIALPREKEAIAPDFKHYSTIPKIEHEDHEIHLLVGDFEEQQSPVEVHSPLSAIDIRATQDTTITITLNPEFEYGLLPLEGEISIAGAAKADIDADAFVYLSAGKASLEVTFKKGSRILLIGGEPLDQPPLMWWNFVAWEQETIEKAITDWNNESDRFPNVINYEGKSARLISPPIEGQLKSRG